MRRNLAVMLAGMSLPPIATVGLLLLNRALCLPVGIMDWDRRLLIVFFGSFFATGLLAAAWLPFRLAAARNISGRVGRLGLFTFSALFGVVFATLVLNFATDQGYAMFEPILLGATHYSDGFSEQAWSRIRIGMPADDVRRLVGKPLHIAPNGPNEADVWTYSEIGHYHTTAEKGFHLRRLVIRRELVTRVIERYLTADQINPMP